MLIIKSVNPFLFSKSLNFTPAIKGDNKVHANII